MSKTIVTMLLCAVSLLAHAVPFDPTYPIGPYAQPSWFVPSESGSGFLFGFLPTTQPTLFGAYYTYTQSSGDSAWLVFQGTYTLNTDLQRVQTGMIATATSPLYEGAAGACLACPYVAPTVATTAVGPATISFPTTTRMQFQFSGGSKTLVPLDTAAVKTIPDLLVGTWSGTYKSKPRFDSPPVESGGCHIRITRTSNPTSSEVFTRATANVREIPAPNSIYFKAEPVPVTGTLCDVDINERWFVMDPTTFATNVYFFGSSPMLPETNSIPVANGVHDVFILSPNSMVIRYYRANQVGNADMEAELRFARDAAQ